MKKILICFLFMSLFVPSFLFAQEAPPVQQDTYAKGVVEEVIQEEQRQEFQFGIITQELRVTISSGEEKGQIVTVRHEVEPGGPAGLPLFEKGNKVIVGKNTAGETVYYISDVYRLNAMWWIFSLFILLSVLFARWYGVRALFGLAISFVVIMWYVVPKIASGGNPLLICIIGTLAIAATSIFVAHGFHARTKIAFVSTLITIALAFALAWLAIQLTQLFGIGSEEAFYLRFAPIENLNLQWLLLGGILIGMLGVLDDVTTAQAAAVEEISKADPTLGFTELYKRGSSVGREHIISLVNTLVLAYTGASLPLLLLFEIYDRPAWVTLNSEMVMEEVVRMLIGSIALVLAVPLTTVIAARWFGALKKDNIHI